MPKIKSGTGKPYRLWLGLYVTKLHFANNCCTRQCGISRPRISAGSVAHADPFPSRRTGCLRDRTATCARAGSRRNPSPTSNSDFVHVFRAATDVTLIPMQGVGPYMAGDVHHLTAAAGQLPNAAAVLRTAGEVWAATDLDGIEAATWVDPPLTTVEQPILDIARTRSEEHTSEL